MDNNNINTENAIDVEVKGEERRVAATETTTETTTETATEAATEVATEARAPRAKTRADSRKLTRTIAGIAVFAALGFAMSLATSWIKVSGFLSLDLKDAMLTIGAFVYGPLAAIPMSLITVILEAVTVGSTGPIGALMDFVSSAAFASVAALIYKYRRNISGAIIGFAVATVAYTAVMMPMNLLLTPLYVNQPFEVVRAMLLPLLLPFNFAKALVNSAFAMLIYKPVSTALSLTGLKEKRSANMSFGRGTLAILAAALVAAALAVLVLVFIW